MNGGQYRLTKQYVERRRTGNYCSGSQQRLAIKRHSKTTKFGNWTYFDVEMTGFFVLSMRITTILRRTATTRVAHGRIANGIPRPTATSSGSITFIRNRRLAALNGGHRLGATSPRPRRADRGRADARPEPAGSVFAGRRLRRPRPASLRLQPRAVGRTWYT